MTDNVVRRPAPGVAVTLWTGGNMLSVLPPKMRDLLAECRPQIVCLHAGPDRLASALERLARDVRALVPGVRLHLGVGCDEWMGDAIRGECTEEKAVSKLVGAAHRGAALGVEAVVWDAEAACKLDSLRAFRMGREVIGRVRTDHPDLLQGHTAYDHPTLHRDDADGAYDDGARRGEYAWRAFCGDGGVDFDAWQNYVAPAQAPGAPPRFAGRGALARRIATSDASVDRAEALGWVRRGLPRERYFQLHHVPFAQTVTAGERAGVVYGWCGPRAPVGRMDVSGEYALRGLCALERAGARRPGGIAAWQRARGITADGVAGRQTLATFGIHVPADVL